MKSFTLRNIHQKKEEILRFTNPPQPHMLREALSQAHPAEMAEILRLLRPGQLETILGVLEDDRVVHLLRILRTDKHLRLMVVRHIAPQRLANLLGAVGAPALADILDGFTEPETQEILALLPQQAARDLEDLRRTATVGPGRILTKDFMKVSDVLTVSETLRTMHQMRHIEGRPNEVYITDARDVLAGMINLHDLLLEKDESRAMRDVMHECIVRIQANATAESAARTVLYYGVGSAPVVDESNHLVGVVTSGAAYAWLEKQYEAQINSIMGFPALSGFVETESASMTFRRSLRLLPTLCAASAAGAALALFVRFLHPQKDILNALPLIPLLIASGRIYYRHTLLLMEEAGMGKIWAAAFKPRYIRISILLGLAFSAPVAAASWLLHPGLAFAAAAGVSNAAAVTIGSSLALTGVALVSRLRVGKAPLLTPALLSLCDFLCLAAGYLLFHAALR